MPGILSKPFEHLMWDSLSV